MDPHEQWHYYQQLLEEQRMIRRLTAAFEKVRQLVPEKPRHTNHLQPGTDTEDQLTDISPKRSGRIAGFVRDHKKAFVGGSILAGVAAIAGELYRRTRGKK
jgi:hypothetical protein